MIPIGFTTRWIAVVGMCCLTLLGAAPRIDCLCPDGACQLACEQLLAPLLDEAAAECAEKPVCCCHHDQSLPQSSGEPAIQASGCHCDLQVVQDQSSPAARNDGKLPPPLVIWLASDDGASTASGPARPLDRHFFTGLPPDDPVSRAQILRL